MKNQGFAAWLKNQLIRLPDTNIPVDEIVNLISRKENISYIKEILSSLTNFSVIVAEAIEQGYKDLFVSGTCS